MTYNSEEMQQILEVAFRRKQQGEYTREQIIEIASELGVSSESLQAAEQEWLKNNIEVKQEQMSNSQQRKGFKSHLFAFLAINGFLVLLNLVVSPGYFWAMNNKLVKNAIFELDNTEKAQLQDYSIRKNFFKEIKKNIKTSKSNKTILIGLIDQI